MTLVGLPSGSADDAARALYVRRIEIGVESVKQIEATSVPLLPHAQALESGDPVLALQAHALAAVVALIPSAFAVFASVSRRLSVERAVALQDPRAGGEPYPCVADLGDDDPFGPRLLAPSGTTVLALEHVTDRAPEHAAALHADGWGDRLVMYLRLAGTVAGVVSLLRPLEQPRFSVADASKLRRIQPLLEHVYSTSIEPSGDSSRRVLVDSGLTPREVDVAELVGRGASNAEIARSLHVTEATVKTHLTRIYTKVGVRTRTQLALLVGGGA